MFPLLRLRDSKGKSSTNFSSAEYHEEEEEEEEEDQKSSFVDLAPKRLRRLGAGKNFHLL